MILREYMPSDCEQLAVLFYQTVHTVNASDYTDEQLDVWATESVDLAEWNKSLFEHYTVIAVDNDIIVGFSNIDKNGYLDRLYVHKHYQNQGIKCCKCNRG